ncbi:hypothetical protein [Maribacter sp. 2307ULW6-5]|uniref:hypothetical protein n=1 Tax=Maribacter sp. 2307ULW6-5 TaxID=3386275 RepID=UPI0039BD03B7
MDTGAKKSEFTVKASNIIGAMRGQEGTPQGGLNPLENPVASVFFNIWHKGNQPININVHLVGNLFFTVSLTSPFLKLAFLSAINEDNGVHEKVKEPAFPSQQKMLDT